MEENLQFKEPVIQTSSSSSFILPPHKNRMVMSVLCTLFCCQIGGIIAIIYSSKSNSAYNSANYCTDNNAKMTLYNQSEQYNNTAKTWLIVSLITGIVYVVAVVIAAATGALAEYM